MKIIRVDENWYRAEQRIENGLLSYVLKALSSTPAKAIAKLLQKINN